VTAQKGLQSYRVFKETTQRRANADEALTYDIRNMPTENFLKLLPEEFSARW
jgi:hypothetical protein